MTSATPTLDQLQHWLLAAITRSADIRPHEIGGVVTASCNQNPAERLAVYQHAYLARLLEVLREQFPCTRFAIGDDLFDQFALGYVQQHPPSGYSLASLADQLAEHLDATRPREMAGSALVVELARLERAIDQVFDGPGPERLPGFSLPAAAAEDLRLTLSPGAQLLACAFPASTYYTAWKAGRQPEWPEPEPQYLVLFRRDYIVRRLELSALQFALLQRLAAGDTVSEALICAAEQAQTLDGPRADELARDIRKWFTHWAAAGLFAAAH